MFSRRAQLQTVNNAAHESALAAGHSSVMKACMHHLHNAIPYQVQWPEYIVFSELIVECCPNIPTKISDCAVTSTKCIDSCPGKEEKLASAQ